MPTSGSTDFNLVTNSLIEEACSICGIASEGEPVSAYTYADATRSLNLIAKAWSASGHLWIKTEASVTLVAAQTSYALATLFSKKPSRVLSVRRKATSGGVETPLLEWSREQYFDQPNKATATVPTSFYYDPQRATGALYIWPTASTATAAAQTLQVTYLRPIEDFDGSSDDPDLPQEWTLALVYALAEQLALKYGAKPDLRREIGERAAIYKAQIESWDTEPASLFLQPAGPWG